MSTSASVRFISFEPIIEVFDNLPLYNSACVDWVIMGRLTGHGKKHDPPISQIKDMVEHFQFYKIPIFLKNNLSGIWPDELIQEVPE